MNARFVCDRVRLQTAIVCAGLGLAGLGGGCQSPEQTEAIGPGASTASGAAVMPVQDPMLENLPVPMGFRRVPERSLARATGKLRMAQCEYEGSTSPADLVRFYESQMPTAQFALKERRLDAGVYSLRFESDSEVCNLRIKRAKSKTILVIDLGPLPKGAGEREAKPLPAQRLP